MSSIYNDDDDDDIALGSENRHCIKNDPELSETVLKASSPKSLKARTLPPSGRESSEKKTEFFFRTEA